MAREHFSQKAAKCYGTLYQYSLGARYDGTTHKFSVADNGISCCSEIASFVKKELGIS